MSRPSALGLASQPMSFAAYEEAVRRATGARSTIDVSDLTRSEPNA